MRVRFLLGPSGVGKTWQCLDEVRRELVHSPEGSPLIFLTPKQATFQVERQLLADGSLEGFTRLQIFSFERFALWLLEQLGARPSLLNAQGRVMVLRSLVGKHASNLDIFRASAHFSGFSQELADLIGELKHLNISADTLNHFASNAGGAHTKGKLQDVARLMRAYDEWLAKRGLHDGDELLSLTIAELKKAPHPPRIAGLWLDSFAELTPKEAELLQAICPNCEQITLAFNICAEPADGWLSPWAQGNQTVKNLRGKFAEIGVSDIEVTRLDRRAREGRFHKSVALARLEACWESGAEKPPANLDGSVRILNCASREAEAIAAAREIVTFVRNRNCRYRDIAVLVRDLELYHDVVAQVFRRYGIPCFVDRREAVHHHPLAELTRSALRIVAFGWKHEDWFSSLKTGLVDENARAIDQLENQALACGLDEDAWLKGFPDNLRAFEDLRKKLTAPFKHFRKALPVKPTGSELADALSSLWTDLDVEAQLKAWTESCNEQVHTALWKQMQEWLDDLRRAFGNDALALDLWMPIIESGLGAQNVGLIPPALDQVLVGAVHRSRNPDLKLAIVLGLNEGVFPAIPAHAGLLTAWEREWLRESGVPISANLQADLAREQFYGYIAFTRARERLVLTFASAEPSGGMLKPSRFIRKVQELTAATIEQAAQDIPLTECEHSAEALQALLRANAASLPNDVAAKKWLEPVVAHLDSWGAMTAPPALTTDIATELYGQTLAASISTMEDFGSCPFRFFLSQGLQARERAVRKVDAREEGTLRHEILSAFHEKVRSMNKEWRDLEPEQAANLLQEIAAEMLPEYGKGMLKQSAQSEFEAAEIVRRLQDFIRVIVGWMREAYGFSPMEAEIRIEWRLKLSEKRTLLLNGKVDRIDIARGPDGAACVVMDYKSSGEKLNDLLCAHGIQIQLLAYLGAVVESGLAKFGGELKPAGVFYIPLKIATGSARHRREARESAGQSLKEHLRHSGRFDLSYIKALSTKHPQTAEHIRCKYTKNEAPWKGQNDGCAPEEFEQLLARTKETLVKFGERIYDGEIAIAPFELKSKCACDDCRFEAVCRFDAWSQPSRYLANKAPVAEPET